MKSGLINFDILHDENDIALLFHVDVQLKDASLLSFSNGLLVLLYNDGRRLPLAKCAPALWARISGLDSILCSRMSASKFVEPDSAVIPVVRS